MNHSRHNDQVKIHDVWEQTGMDVAPKKHSIDSWRAGLTGLAVWSGTVEVKNVTKPAVPIECS